MPGVAPFTPFESRDSTVLSLCGLFAYPMSAGLFHHKHPVSAITDIDPARGDNRNLIWGSEQ